MLKYEIPVLPVASGLRGLGRYISPLRCAYVGLSLTTSEISSGSGASPAKRSVANALIVFSEFVIDVAMLIRDYTVIVYDNAVRSTKIARVLNFMNRLSEVHARDTELIGDVLRRIPWLIPNDAGHAQVYNSRADQSLNYGFF